MKLNNDQKYYDTLLQGYKEHLLYSMYILLFPLWKKSNCNRLGHEPNVSTCQICCPLVTRLALNQFKGAAAVKKRPSQSLKPLSK